MVNVTDGHCAATITTRYEAIGPTNIITLAHYPMTVVLYEFENKTIVNAADGGGIALVRTIKANYFKMGAQNLLFTQRNSFLATGVILEYE